MNATIWHHPRCSKSREALALLRSHGVEPTIVEYQKMPPSRDEIARLLARAGIAPAAALRRDAPAVDGDEAALDLMARDAATIERPLVETDRGAVLARPPERVLDIL